LTRDPVIEVSTSIASQTIAHEIHRPAVVGDLRLGQRLAFERSDAFALTPPHRQSRFAIQPIGEFAVHSPPFSTQLDVNASITITTLLRRDLADPRAQLRALRSSRVVAIQ